MTKEEAVIILEGFKNNPLINSTHAQAFAMAISALSAIEKIRAEIQENLDRCKEFGWEEESRDDVIKAYTEVLEIIDKHIGGKDK